MVAFGEVSVEPARLRFIGSGQPRSGAASREALPTVPGSCVIRGRLAQAGCLTIHGVLQVVRGRVPGAELAEPSSCAGDLGTDAGNLVKKGVNFTKDLPREAIEGVVEPGKVGTAVRDPAVTNLDCQDESLIDTLLGWRDANQGASWVMARRLRHDSGPRWGKYDQARLSIIHPGTSNPASAQST